MAQTVSLSASPRQATGKGAARQARFRGRVPAVIYGHGRDTQPLELEAKALEKALQAAEAELTIATAVPPRAEEVAAPSPEATTEVAEPELIRKVREGEEEEGEAAAEGGAPAKPEAKGGGGAAPAKGEKTEKAEKPKGGKES